MSESTERPRGWFWRLFLPFVIGAIVFFAFEALVVLPLLVALVQRNLFATSAELAAAAFALSCAALFAITGLVSWLKPRQTLEQQQQDEAAWLEVVSRMEWRARRLRSMTPEAYEARSRRLQYANAILFGVLVAAVPLSIVADHFEIGLALTALAFLGGLIAEFLPSGRGRPTST